MTGLATDREARQHQIHDLWLAGLTVRSIGRALETPMGTVAHEVWRMRQQGWDLPRRNGNGGRPTAEEALDQTARELLVFLRGRDVWDDVDPGIRNHYRGIVQFCNRKVRAR